MKTVSLLVFLCNTATELCLSIPKLRLAHRKLRRCLFSPHMASALFCLLSGITGVYLQATHLTIWHKYHWARAQRESHMHSSSWAPLSAPWFIQKWNVGVEKRVWVWHRGGLVLFPSVLSCSQHELSKVVMEQYEQMTGNWENRWNLNEWFF